MWLHAEERAFLAGWSREVDRELSPVCQLLGGRAQGDFSLSAELKHTPLEWVSDLKTNLYSGFSSLLGLRRMELLLKFFKGPES